MLLIFSFILNLFNVNVDNEPDRAEKVLSKPAIVVKEGEWLYHSKGFASWYGDPNMRLDRFHGRTTANGEKYNTYNLTAAHKKMKFGTIVKVTNLNNGKYVIVRINDRGPYIRGRIIDLSWAAKKEIMGNSGLCKVKLEIWKKFENDK